MFTEPCYALECIDSPDYILASSTMNNSNRSSAAFAISLQNSLFGISFLDVMVYMRRSTSIASNKHAKDRGDRDERTESR
jgi:hypothetical protein